jgi:phenylglyoxylate dehydrogenase beta subunit
MTTFYDVLEKKHGGCLAGCQACEQACAREKGGEARIRSVHVPEVGFRGVVSCIQCGEPACMPVCPVRAITKSEIDGVVRIEESKCMGCGLCHMACPYGGIYLHPVRRVAIKCDTCDGEMKCVRACEYEVLTVGRNHPLLSYLGEDIVSPGTPSCPGCIGMLSGRFALRVLAKDKRAVILSCPGCTPFVAAMSAIPCQFCLMPHVAAVASGIKRQYDLSGREDVKVIAFVGDGATADVGFQSLSGAAERDENIVFICSDNEAYMNTGIQRSSTTPMGAWTFTTPVGAFRQGKEQQAKYMPLLMAIHGAAYVATATMGYPQDYAQKLAKALEVKKGLVYIHLFSPCPPGWRAPEDSGIEISRMAVKTNYFPLWEAEGGKFRLTHREPSSRPIGEFTKLMGRFSHLDEMTLEKLQKAVDSRFRLIEGLCSLASQGD